MASTDTALVCKSCVYSMCACNEDVISSLRFLSAARHTPKQWRQPTGGDAGTPSPPSPISDLPPSSHPAIGLHTEPKLSVSNAATVIREPHTLTVARLKNRIETPDAPARPKENIRSVGAKNKHTSSPPHTHKTGKRNSRGCACLHSCLRDGDTLADSLTADQLKLPLRKRFGRDFDQQPKDIQMDGGGCEM